LRMERMVDFKHWAWAGIVGGTLAIGTIVAPLAARASAPAVKDSDPIRIITTTPSNAGTAAAQMPLKVLLPDGLTPPDVAAPSPVIAASTTAPLRWVYMVGTSLPQSLRDHADQIDVISPAWFKSDANGMIYGNDSPAVTQFAREHNIKVIP